MCWMVFLKLYIWLFTYILISFIVSVLWYYFNRCPFFLQFPRLGWWSATWSQVEYKKYSCFKVLFQHLFLSKSFSSPIILFRPAEQETRPFSSASAPTREHRQEKTRRRSRSSSYTRSRSRSRSHSHSSSNRHRHGSEKRRDRRRGRSRSPYASRYTRRYSNMGQERKTCLSKTATLPDMFMFIFEIIVILIWICQKFLEKSTF